MRSTRDFIRSHRVPLIILLATIAVQISLTSQVVDAGELTIQSLIKCTNEIRLKYVDNELFINPKLTVAAENKLNDMAQYGYWAHENPTTGKKPWDFVDEAGYYYETTGENLAIGFENSEEICKAWEKSPKHFENLVNPDYLEIGFAIDKANLRKDARGILVVLMFGSRNDFTGPVQSGNAETLQLCEEGSVSCPQEGIPQVEGAKTIKNPTTEKESPQAGFNDNIASVIVLLLLSYIFMAIYKKMSHKYIPLLVIAAIVTAIVALNINYITKYIFHPADQMQTSVIELNNNTATDGTKGRVDVEDVENSSITRRPSVQK